MIGVGMMDRQVILYTRSEINDSAYGGVTSASYVENTEKIYSDVVWKSGKIGDDGNQMQNNQIIEFYVRNGGAMKSATVEDYIFFEDKKYYINAINVIDGREKFLQVITTNVMI